MAPATRLHVTPKVPLPPLVNVTVPNGVTLVPASLSSTVAVQVVAEVTCTGFGEQLIFVVVVRNVTVTDVVPELVE